MIESNTSLIKHIPYFLDYCKKEKGLADKTQENYQRYLQKFIFWLEKTKKENLLPHQLTIDDILKYRLFLSRYQEKGKELKKITQNYYLVALRAFLSYFLAKDIVSLPTDKITLPKGFQKGKTVKFLNLEQIEKLLLAPNTNTKIGLRDRVILEILISTGLKVSQLVRLNRKKTKIDKLSVFYLSKSALFWIKKYLTTRKDNEKALFINYRSRKDADARLTVRSVERIVSKYGRKISLLTPVTPETLRWAFVNALLDEQNKPKIIKRPHGHETFFVENYKSVNKKKRTKRKQHISPLWHIVESIINEEIAWLKDNLSVLPEEYTSFSSLLSYDDVLRKMAILIVSGKVKAYGFKAKRNRDLWHNLTRKQNIRKKSIHGREWHRKMMDTISEYFKIQNCKVVFEPILHYGRADLGIYLNPNKTLYIEVGTVSLFKLWHNLSTMKDATFLIIPSEEYLIEFKVNKL